jgi:hypothetical protein
MMMMMMMVHFVQIGHCDRRMGVFRHTWTDGQIVRWEVELGRDIRSRRVLYLRHLSGKLRTLHACTISLLLRCKEV